MCDLCHLKLGITLVNMASENKEAYYKRMALSLLRIGGGSAIPETRRNESGQ